MAKKPERGARSRAIRDYLKEHQSASPNQVVAALKEQGMKVSVGLVSVIKYSDRPGSLKLTGDTNFENLIRAKKFVAQVGGVEAALTALKTIEMLRG